MSQPVNPIPAATGPWYVTTARTHDDLDIPFVTQGYDDNDECTTGYFPSSEAVAERLCSRLNRRALAAGEGR